MYIQLYNSNSPSIYINIIIHQAYDNPIGFIYIYEYSRHVSAYIL